MKTADRIVKLVRHNPQVSCSELCRMLGITSPSNVHYHIKRLQKRGLIEWSGKFRTRGPESPERQEQRRQRGDAQMPRYTKAEMAERIEMVARKAESAAAVGCDAADAHEDVVRFIHRIQVRRLTAHKIG